MNVNRDSHGKTLQRPRHASPHTGWWDGSIVNAAIAVSGFYARLEATIARWELLCDWRSGAVICATANWDSPFRMPSREKKRGRDISPANVKTLHANERVPLKGQPRPFSRAGNSTRINAFVNTLGRRNQAKRDAR
jgi:hypothetical protein